jgi:cell wall-associated NlpC family hydrolase
MANSFPGWVPPRDLRLDMNGDDVKAAQQALYRALAAQPGTPLTATNSQNGAYGSKTQDDVAALERRVGWSDKTGKVLSTKLAAKHVVPYATDAQLKLWGASSQTLGQRALAIAVKELGVKESPPNSNDGPRVRVYQAETGAYKQAWCASFVAWAYHEAGHQLKGWNTAYCPSYVETARAGKCGLRVVSAADARPGDLVLFDWDGGVADHVGLLETKVASGSFRSIEGNTSTGNDSNGGQVMRRDRQVAQVECFVRVAE